MRYTISFRSTRKKNWLNGLSQAYLIKFQKFRDGKIRWDWLLAEYRHHAANRRVFVDKDDVIVNGGGVLQQPVQVLHQFRMQIRRQDNPLLGPVGVEADTLEAWPQVACNNQTSTSSSD